MALKRKCFEYVPQRRKYELFLLSAFLIDFTVMVIYLWINALTYDNWFYLMLLIVLIIILGGYWMDRKYRPEWEQYLCEIINEMKIIDTIKLSEFINEGQPFLGAVLGSCEKFLKMGENLRKKGILKLIIKGSFICLKGYESELVKFTTEKPEEKND
ncbi:MAG: hypothetical protein ACTSRS_13370 [Candidatus Helarchaeota archaeon]